MTTSWLVLCAAGGHEREAARVVNRNDGASYIPKTYADGRERALMPGYVFATWLHEVPWHKLEVYKTPRGNALIWGALTQVGSDELARVPQRDLDLMEAYANRSAEDANVVRHKVGDLKPQALGVHQAELPWKVMEIREGLLRKQTMLLGRIIEKWEKVAA